MTNGLSEVIKKLEQQRTAIERALAALREVDSPELESAAAETETPGGPASGVQTKAGRKGGMTAEGRKRLSEALKARWAARKTDSEAPAAAPAPVKAARKGGMTAEGRKRLSEALRKRWAAKRATATPAKRGGRK